MSSSAISIIQMTHERESKTFLAQLCREAERYDEMVIYMTEVAKLGEGLSMEESNLLSTAYKKAISTRRASWRIISSIKQKEEPTGSDKHVSTIRDYLQKIETELEKLCQDIINVLDELLIPKAESGDSKVSYYMMKGDYHRYVAEFASSEKRRVATRTAHEAYKAATDIAQTELAPIHPVRLGLALNLSVFYYKILNSVDHACRLATKALEDAIAELDSLPEDSSRDSTSVMELLRHNLTHWKSFDGTDQTAEETGTAQPSA